MSQQALDAQHRETIARNAAIRLDAQRQAAAYSARRAAERAAARAASSTTT